MIEIQQMVANPQWDIADMEIPPSVFAWDWGASPRPSDPEAVRFFYALDCYSLRENPPC
jgi:hypothetical protein